MFKVGDFIRYIKGKTKTTAKVDIINQIPNYIGVSTGENVHIDECEIWQPQINEWVILSKVPADDWSTFTVTQYCDTTGECEPFIGELPSFIND